MAIILPSDSGLDLTLTTPSGPQTRDPAVFSTLSYRQRVRFWRRQDGAIPVTADPGALLVDFSKQSLTVGVGTAYSNAIGSYTLSRQSQTHESQLTGTSETLTATGWEAACTGSTNPATVRYLRFKFGASPALDLSGVTNFVVELEYPQEMQTGDFGNGYFTGFRIQFLDASSNYAVMVVPQFPTQGITKRRRFALYLPATTKTGGFWTNGGTAPNWSAITTITIYHGQQSTNGGHRVTLRKIWANRVGKKALVAFTFDDNTASFYTNGLPLFNAAGIRCGITVSKDMVVPGGGAQTTGTEVATMYAQGHSLYNHMLSHTYRLESAFTPDATPWSGGLYTGTVNADAYSSMTIGNSYELRGNWGPEVNGSLLLDSKPAANKVSFSVATAPALNSYLVGPVRFDIPTGTRAARIASYVTPCQDYLASLVGPGWRGHDVFTAPNGTYDIDWAPDLEAVGFKVARTTNAAFIGSEAGSPWYVQGAVLVIPNCFDPMDMCWYSLDNMSDSLANKNALEAAVDAAINVGGFLHLGGHEVKATEAALTIKTALLDHVINYVKTKIDAGEAQNVTLEQMAAWYPYDPAK